MWLQILPLPLSPVSPTHNSSTCAELAGDRSSTKQPSRAKLVLASQWKWKGAPRAHGSGPHPPRRRRASLASADRQQPEAAGRRMRREAAEHDGTARDLTVRRGAGAFSLSSRRGSAGRRRRPLRLRPRRHPAKSGADGITARSARAGRGLVPRGIRRPPDWRRKQVWLARHGVSTHATRPHRGSASRLPTRHLPPPCRHLSTSPHLSTGQKLPPIPA